MENTNIQLSKEEHALRNGKIAPLFRRFAIPGVVGLLFLGIQSIIDGIILGNYLGANALASVSLILPCYSLMVALSIVIGIGCQTLVSISLGKMDRQGANDALRSGSTFIFTLSIVAALTLYFFAYEIASAIGANSVLIDGSVNYIRGLSPFIPVMTIFFFCDYTLKALGKPIYAMSIMSLSVVLNITFDLLFITQFNMGTMGAGLATGMAFSVGMLCSLPIVLMQRQRINIFEGRFKWSLVGRMFYNGSSEGVTELSSGVSILLFNITMMHYLGEVGVAAFTALEYILFVCITVFLGISDGIIPIVGYNYGAKQFDRIKQVLKLGVKVNSLIGLTLFTILMLFGEQIVSLFFSSADAKVVEIATSGTKIYAFAFLFNGLNILASSYFTAIANAKISIIISLLRGGVLIVPAVLLLPMLIGIEGIWLAIPLAEALTIVVSYLLVRRSIKGLR